MDGDAGSRFRRIRPGLDEKGGGGWSYSATIGAETVAPRPEVADAQSAPVALRREDENGKGDAKGGGAEGEGAGGEDKAPAKPTPRWKKIVYGLVGLCVLAALVVAGVLYWLHARHFESTDDAFIDGYMSRVSAQVAGRVIDLEVQDNQEVRAGQTLLQVEPRDYQAKLDSAKAQKLQAVGQLDQARAALLQRQADVDQALSQVRVAEADLGQQQNDLARFRSVDPKAITRQQLDTTSAQTRSAAARLDSARQAVSGMRAQVEAQRATIEAAAANVAAADAAVASAALQLGWTTVVAPQDGRVTQRMVDVGNYANVGQALLAVVPENVWVTANFKETQLARMKVGQAVEVSVDACPGRTFPARVQSFQSGTGAVFSSLPAENATGNYVKVVQRVPVKIVFDRAPEGCRLSLGMSVEPRVTVRP